MHAVYFRCARISGAFTLYSPVYGDDSEIARNTKDAFMPFVRHPVRTDHAQDCAYSEERARQRVATKCVPSDHASKMKSSKLVDDVGDDHDVGDDMDRLRMVVGIRQEFPLQLSRHSNKTEVGKASRLAKDDTVV